MGEALLRLARPQDCARAAPGGRRRRGPWSRRRRRGHGAARRRLPQRPPRVAPVERRRAARATKRKMRYRWGDGGEHAIPLAAARGGRAGARQPAGGGAPERPPRVGQAGESLADFQLDSLVVNRYFPGEGIGAHRDPPRQNPKVIGITQRHGAGDDAHHALRKVSDKSHKVDIERASRSAYHFWDRATPTGRTSRRRPSCRWVWSTCSLGRAEAGAAVSGSVQRGGGGGPREESACLSFFSLLAQCRRKVGLAQKPRLVLVLGIAMRMTASSRPALSTTTRRLWPLLLRSARGRPWRRTVGCSTGRPCPAAAPCSSPSPTEPRHRRRPPCSSGGHATDGDRRSPARRTPLESRARRARRRAPRRWRPARGAHSPWPANGARARLGPRAPAAAT